MAAVGIELRSTVAVNPALLAVKTKRLPSTSTNVRRGSRLRRLIWVVPLPPLLTWVLGALPCSGIICRKSPTLATELFSSCCRVITVTGAGVVRSLRRTREPVTVISSSALRLEGAAATVSSAGVVAAAGAFGVGVGSACANPTAGMSSSAAAPGKLRIQLLNDMQRSFRGSWRRFHHHGLFQPTVNGPALNRNRKRLVPLTKGTKVRFHQRRPDSCIEFR